MAYNPHASTRRNNAQETVVYNSGDGFVVREGLMPSTRFIDLSEPVTPAARLARQRALEILNANESIEQESRYGNSGTLTNGSGETLLMYSRPDESSGYLVSVFDARNRMYKDVATNVPEARLENVLTGYKKRFNIMKGDGNGIARGLKESALINSGTPWERQAEQSLPDRLALYDRLEQESAALADTPGIEDFETSELGHVFNPSSLDLQLETQIYNADKSTVRDMRTKVNVGKLHTLIGGFKDRAYTHLTEAGRYAAALVLSAAVVTNTAGIPERREQLVQDLQPRYGEIAMNHRDY